MNIRKADSKGRVTGFEPGQHYEVRIVPDANGGFAIVAQPLATSGYVSGTVHEGDFS